VNEAACVVEEPAPSESRGPLPIALTISSEFFADRGIALPASDLAIGVLRLRGKFAERTFHFAQDDRNLCRNKISAHSGAPLSNAVSGFHKTGN
jgi:hypothetical protein